MFILLRQLATIRRDTALPRGRPLSLAIRHVDAGSCNGCEHELGATTNPFHDIQRHGLDIVASPRHADILLVTGAVTTRMAGPLRTAYDAMPAPRLVAALGDCALGCNILGDRSEFAAPLEELLPVDIRIPGCPPTPDAIAEHILAALARHADTTLTNGRATATAAGP
jgi:Ni,Fe-hydrogenase III small subunit